MKNQNYIDDSMLHAYIDDELDKANRKKLLVELENNEELRDRICELRHTKEWVKFSFDDVSAPTQSIERETSNRHANIIRMAASIVIILTAFLSGWFGNQVLNNTYQNPTVIADSNHVLLHISQSDDSKFNTLLDKAEAILQKYKDKDTQVEVVANASGLDMLQTSYSHEAERIQQMMKKYDNVRFIACSRGLQKLREQGKNPVLIKGVISDSSAGDHVIQRLQDGWTYITI